MTLWTNTCLLAARLIHVKRGFKLFKAEPYKGFGHDLVVDTQQLKLLLIPSWRPPQTTV